MSNLHHRRNMPRRETPRPVSSHQDIPKYLFVAWSLLVLAAFCSVDAWVFGLIAAGITYWTCKKRYGK